MAVAPISHRDLLKRWPTRAKLARDLRCGYWSIVGWEDQSNIPEKYWPDLIALAKGRGFRDVTIESLRAGAEAFQATKPPRKNAKPIKT
jgi:hypothetical protein